MKSVYLKDAVDQLDFTNGTDAVKAGAFIQVDKRAGQVIGDTAASAKGAIRVRGVIRVNKDASDLAKDAPVFWDADGTDLGGLTGGCANSASDFLIGRALTAAGTAVTTVDVELNEPPLQALLDSTAGTAGGTMAELEATYTEATVANNFASIVAVLKKAGLIA